MYWVIYSQPGGELAAIKTVAEFDSVYRLKADYRERRRRDIPGEKAIAAVAAQPDNLALLDAEIARRQTAEDKAKQTLDNDPTRHNLNEWKRARTQRVLAESERTRVAGREAVLDDELDCVQEVAEAVTVDDAKKRWGGRFSLDGTSFLFSVDAGDPEPVVGPFVQSIGDASDTRAFIHDNDSDWNPDAFLTVP